MKQQEEIRKIMNEYCSELKSHDNVKDWVRSVLSFNVTQPAAISLFRGGGSIKHRDCWVVYDPFSEYFYISRTRDGGAAATKDNGVHLALEDYLTVSYGVHSLQNVKTQVLMSSLELNELSETIADDVHAWCVLLEGTSQPA